MRSTLALACLVLSGCIEVTSHAAPAPPEPIPVRIADIPTQSAEDPSGDSAGSIETIRDLFTATEVRGRWISSKEASALKEAGLDATLTLAGLRDAVARCGKADKCALPPEDHQLVEALVRFCTETGTVDMVPALLQLDRFGFYTDSAVEHILARLAAKDSSTCEAPGLGDVAAAREDLTDFVVLDRIGSDLIGRWPTETERDDLAYFYAAITDAGPAMGSTVVAQPQHREIDPVQAAARKDHQHDLSDALDHGDLDRAQRAAVAYLSSLGYPGPIDASQEPDQAWGGARFSFVMRDLALVSEVVGEVDIAADLYRRADPGGGACGTSVDYRRGKQLRGLIRSEERAGHCRSIVPLRLLDWDHEYDPGKEKDPGVHATYGPGRLAADGWDVARIYRGALLTRNRHVEPGVLEAALLRSPGDIAVAGGERLRRLGVEAWEFQVRALEGIADTGGREALDVLQELLATGSDDVRKRTVVALGDMAKREWAGPCPPDSFRIGGMSMSNIWSRRVSKLGTTCETQLRDQAANALARRITLFARASNREVRNEAILAVGKLAAPRSRRQLARWARDASTKLERACDGVEEWSQACQDARQYEDAASAAWETWSTVVDRPAED